MEIKVVHGVGWYFPEHTGGTEVYVRELISGLEKRSVKNIVLVPGANQSIQHRVVDGVDVYLYPIGPGKGVREARGVDSWAYQDDFRRLLNSSDLYHQHSWTTGCGFRQLQAARDAGLKTVVTVHVPNLLCMRGTMMLHGESACDGAVMARRCGTCWVESKGWPTWLGELLVRLPGNLSRLVHDSGLAYGIGGALSVRALVEGKKTMLESLAKTADRVVAVSGWLHKALLNNGFDPDKTVLCRQGVPRSFMDDGAVVQTVDKGGILTIGYLGRWNPVKGLQMLFDAVEAVPPKVSLRLLIFGIARNEEDQAFRRAMSERLVDNKRVVDCGEVTREGLKAAFGQMDVLAVPSQWMETGPLVALEAQAAGVPVVGSRLGGIEELVRDGIDGILLPHDSTRDWTSCLTELAEDTSRVTRMKESLGPVRDMGSVVEEMENLYRSIVLDKTSAVISS